jgi:membrane protease YdiL (CAAX protease family)
VPDSTLDAALPLDAGILEEARPAASLRARVAVELGVLATLTAAFLAAFPERSMRVDLPLALAAWGLIGLNAGYTRTVMWAVRAETDPRLRRRGDLRLLGLTAFGMGAFMLVGAFLGFRSGGWTAAVHRLFPLQILFAFLAYVAWAFLQQTLFQFYLLGRLIRLLPAAPPLVLCALNGLAFSSVHWPDPVLMALTAAAGAIWSWSYYRYRRLWPIVLSHAALGATFFYWVYGHPLGADWLRALVR